MLGQEDRDGSRALQKNLDDIVANEPRARRHKVHREVVEVLADYRLRLGMTDDELAAYRVNYPDVPLWDL